MNLQKKALAIVIPLIVLLSAAHIFHLSLLKNKHIDQLIESFDQRLHQHYKHYIEKMIDLRYGNELNMILLDSEVVAAVREQDREALIGLIKPIFQLLRRENPHVQRMHFHRPDGISLLRIHMPDKFGDDIASVRPALREVHSKQRPFSAVEMGRHGLFYRLFQPIYDQGSYIGAVEIGISIDYLLETMEEALGVEGFLVVGKEVVSVLKNKDIPPEYFFGDYLLLTEGHPDTDWIGKFDITEYTIAGNTKGRKWLLHTLALPVANDHPKAYIVLKQDITDQYNERDAYLWGALITTVIVIALVILTLRFTLTPIMAKLESVNKRLSYEVAKVSKMSITDSLTRIYNRQKFDESMKSEIITVKRYQVPLSLMMFDLDHFKQVNDTHGHAVGDRILQDICRIVKQNIRANDIFARWGGEEFMIILPHQALDGAIVVAEKLRTAIEAHRFPDVGSITISVGVAQFHEQDDFELLIKRVDDNLYKAKDEGRNRVISS